MTQLERRYSYPSNNNNNNNKNKSPGRSVNVYPVQQGQVYPLTEENLALHTKNYPPSKDAKRANTRKYVDSQWPVIEMELLLQQQLLQETRFDENQQPRRKKWFNKLAHWIRSDSQQSKEKKRHLSWSPGLENHKVIDCQKRDSGISFFSTNNNRRHSLFSSIPIVRQPKFSPAEKSKHLCEFKAFPYPKMEQKPTSTVDNNKDALSPPTTTTTIIIGETNNQRQRAAVLNGV